MRALRLILFMIEEVRGRGLKAIGCPPPKSKVEPNIRWKFYEGDTKHVALYSPPVKLQILRKENLLVDIRGNGIFCQIRFFSMAYK